MPPVARATALSTAALHLAIERRSGWLVGQLAEFLARAEFGTSLPFEPPEPYALGRAGAWGPAAAKWSELGCPYEAALACDVLGGAARWSLQILIGAQRQGATSSEGAGPGGAGSPTTYRRGGAPTGESQAHRRRQ